MRSDFHLMKIIPIIHLTAGGLGRRGQQTVTHTVQSLSQTNGGGIARNSKLAPALLPADQVLFGLLLGGGSRGDGGTRRR